MEVELLRKRKKCFLALGKCRNAKYEEIITKTTLAVCEAKLKAFKEGECDIYRMAKRRQSKPNDIGLVKCIKDKHNNILVHDENTNDRWSEHFYKLFNE